MQLVPQGRLQTVQAPRESRYLMDLLQVPPVAPVEHGHRRASRVEQQLIPDLDAVLVLGARARGKTRRKH
jgi:hypothetical protein